MSDRDQLKVGRYKKSRVLRNLNGLVVELLGGGLAIICITSPPTRDDSPPEDVSPPDDQASDSLDAEVAAGFVLPMVSVPPVAADTADSAAHDPGHAHGFQINSQIF